MNLATRDRREIINSDVATTPVTQVPAPISEVSLTFKTGDAPYAYIFGNAKYDSLHNKTAKIKNLSGTDVIVCLFSKKEFVRCVFVKENDSFEITHLPLNSTGIGYVSGLCFDSSLRPDNTDIRGVFSENQEFYKSTKANLLNSFNELTLLPGLNKGFKKVDEKDFFYLTKK